MSHYGPPGQKELIVIAVECIIFWLVFTMELLRYYPVLAVAEHNRMLTRCLAVATLSLADSRLHVVPVA